VLVEPELICRDIDASADAHYIVAYKLNLKLIEIARKYVSMTSKTETPRSVVTWVNEFDEARILVIYDDVKKSFEEFEALVVDRLYQPQRLLCGTKRPRHVHELLKC